MHFNALLTVEIPAVPEDEGKKRELMEEMSAREPSGNIMRRVFQEELQEMLQPGTALFSRMVCCRAEEMMAPYNMDARDSRYLAFYDCTEELKAEYAAKVDCIRFANGRIIEIDSYPSCGYCIRDGKVYQKAAGPLHHEKRTKSAKRITALPGYPRSRRFKDFEDFVTNWYGFVRDAGYDAYGYYYNPNGVWDGFQIGGRWQDMFLVKDTCTEYFEGEQCWSMVDREFEAPEGFRWVTAARKKDIEWKAMRDWRDKEERECFYRMERMFSTGKLEDDFLGEITEDGITRLGGLDYYKGESVDAYMARMGMPENWRYPFAVCGIVDADRWLWREIYSWQDIVTREVVSSDWRAFLDEYIDKLDDDMVLVSIDYHT